MKKIAFLIQDLEHGGAQKHTVEIAKTINRAFDTKIIVHAKGISRELVGESYINNCIEIGESGLINPKKWYTVNNKIKSLNPDLIVAVNQIATILAIIGKIIGILDCPIAIVFHTTQINDWQKFIRTIPFYVLTRLADCLIYISENQQKYWLSKGLRAKRVKCIVNGINTDGFIPFTPSERRDLKTKLGIKPDEFIIGCLAVMRHEKNHILLVEALKDLREKNIPAKVLLVGDGPLRQEIEKKVSDLNLNEFVIFAGMQSDVKSFIGAMDVGVIVSKGIETLSLAALETMAMEVPMIMSDIGGASEIIEEGVTGYLFESENKKMLVEKLMLAYNSNNENILGKLARKTVLEKFTQDEMVRQYKRLFESLLVGKKE